ncbi:MAG: HlyD family efflux transporter periplasmic adaptor subunit [Pirellulaceae bacterium]
MKRIGRWLLWGGLLAVVASALYLALQPQPIEVETAKVSRAPMEVAIEEDGMTRIKDRYVVSSNVGGSLLRIELRPGDEIKQGQTLLATLQPSDPSMLDARQLSQAQATVDAARVAVERAEARKGQAKAAADLAEAQFGRTKKLFDANSIPREEYDVAVAAHRARQEEMRVANFETKIAEFELKQAEAALEHFTSDEQQNDNRIQIRSPIDGRVLRVLQESATVLMPGTPLLEVGNPEDLEVVIDVLSSDAVRITPGDRVELLQWGGDSPILATVRVVEPAAFTKISALGVEEQRVNVIADFESSDDVVSRLGDAYRVEARIIVWHADDVLTVPTSALFREDGRWMSFRNVEGHAQKVELKIGKRNAVTTEIVEGLQVDDEVIIYPSDMIHDGSDLSLKQ